MAPPTEMPPLPLPEGITSRQIDLTSFGHLSFHILEAGSPKNPLILLLHGFPMLAYSWRRIMLPLANAGYYVVAPDQRGYGRTVGWDDREYSDVDLHTFSTPIFVRDVLVLVSALAYTKVKCVVGIDAGGVTAGACAVIRPDIFESVMLLTHPFNGTPSLLFGVANKDDAATRMEKKSAVSIHDELAARGRKHYKWYYSTPEANSELTHSASGLGEFLRGYFYVKSASWAGNDPHPLEGGWTADALVNLPYYYIMPLDSTMPEAIAELMSGESIEAIEASKEWLTDEDVKVFASEFSRTTFRGGLNWYRAYTNSQYKQVMDVFAGRKIDIPCAFIAGDKDWGTYQEPGTIEKMRDGTFCSNFRFFKMVKSAGHWIPQEKPDEVIEGILELLQSIE